MKALKMSEQRVDFVLDTYNPPCLKDITRDIQDDDLDDSDEVYSFGSGEKTTFNFLSLLKHSNFKKKFLNKLKKSEEIQKNKYKFAYSVMKECYKWRMFMTFMALMMNLIHMLPFRQYTLNS